MPAITGNAEQRWEAARRIQNRNPHVVFTRDAEGVPTGVDARATAKANLAAIPDEFRRAATPDATQRAKADDDFIFEGADRASAKLQDAFDVPALPFRVARDLSFAAAHGLRSLFGG